MMKKIFREEIIEALYEYFGRLELTCAEYEDGGRLLSEFGSGKLFDAVFLDIEMPVADGMKTAQELRRRGYTGPILFLTSHTEFAMDGYEVEAFRFLAKPIDRTRLNRALGELKRELFRERRITIRCEGEEVILLLDDIIYIEAMNNSVSVVTAAGAYAVRKKLSDMEEELAALADFFCRIHRGYIVNLSHVKRHGANEVFVTGGAALPVSRSLANDFKRRLFEYVKNSAG